MITPGEAGAWIVQNLWVVALVLWGLVLFGVGGTIYAIIKWAMRGVKQIFNPFFLIILIILVGLTLFVASWVQGLVSGWW